MFGKENHGQILLRYKHISYFDVSFIAYSSIIRTSDYGHYNKDDFLSQISCSIERFLWK